MNPWVNVFNYNRLVEVVKTEPCFRKRPGEYPLVERRFSTRWFTVREEADGARSFVIYNGYRWERVDLTKEEFEEHRKNNHKQTYHYHDPVEKTDSYFRYDKIPDELGVLSSDGFLELTAENMNWGNRYLLNCASFAYYKADRRRGGVIGRSRRGGVIGHLGGGNMVPLCKGMRIRPVDGALDPKHTYKLVGKRVNRNKTKEYSESKSGFFKVAQAMMQSTPMRVFIDVAVDNLLDRKFFESKSIISWWAINSKKEHILKEAVEIMDDEPLDAAAMFCMAFDCHSFRSKVASAAGTYSTQSSTPDEPTSKMFIHMKKRIKEAVCKHDDSMMVEKEFPVGYAYPASKWKYTFFQDGVALEQYK